jgi:hypothetical protein
VEIVGKYYAIGELMLPSLCEGYRLCQFGLVNLFEWIILDIYSPENM